jgi:hypothetical protein
VSYLQAHEITFARAIKHVEEYKALGVFLVPVKPDRTFPWEEATRVESYSGVIHVTVVRDGVEFRAACPTWKKGRAGVIDKGRLLSILGRLPRAHRPAILKPMEADMKYQAREAANYARFSATCSKAAGDLATVIVMARKKKGRAK